MSESSPNKDGRSFTCRILSCQDDYYDDKYAVTKSL